METIGHLSGGMAHDFNNVLGVIIGNLDLLGRRIKADPLAEELRGEASQAALRGADLTRRLLAFGAPLSRCGRKKSQVNSPSPDKY